MITLDEVLELAIQKSASDIHATVGRPISLRINGELIPIDENDLTDEAINELMVPLLAKKGVKEIYEELGEADFSYELGEKSRYRVNVFRQRGHSAFVMRQLPFKIPEPGPLGVPKAVVDTSNLKRGLVLVTGATGSGKSTTLASILGLINEREKKHIITIEDPVEYVYDHKAAEVNQRELGQDTKSFANALRAILREDPDVILVGEMRDPETIELALVAAETGHLVFSTLHTNSAPSTIDRIVDVFAGDKQNQIRVQLANVLECVCCQQLIKRKDGKGRMAVHEVMLATPAIRNLIREGKSYQVYSQIQVGKKLGMQTMDDALYNAYVQNKITSEDCLNYSVNYQEMKQKLQTF